MHYKVIRPGFLIYNNLETKHQLMELHHFILFSNETEESKINFEHSKDYGDSVLKLWKCVLLIHLCVEGSP